MPIDPPIDDGGYSFVWTCTRCPERGGYLTWLSAALALRDHRADQHGLHTSETHVGIRTVVCVDCGSPVTVKRARQPRCDDCRLEHARAGAKARRERTA